MKGISIYCFLFVVSLVVGADAQFARFCCSAISSGATTWTQLKIGAGGYLTGMDISADGALKVVRTDTYGAWASVANGAWSQLTTITSMPIGDVDQDSGQGVYEIAVAPGSSSRLYMYFNGYIYRSSNTGATWTRTAFSQVAADYADGVTKTMGRFIAVDPVNADHVLIGTPSGGLWRSTDGNVFAKISTIANASTPSGAAQGGGHLIAFDPSSSVSSGKTQGIYATSYGTGVYHSADAGVNWTLLNTSGMPTTHNHLVVAVDGVVFQTGYAAGGPNTVYKYASGAWSNILADGSNAWNIILTDPNNAARVIVWTGGGIPNFSTDRGGSWSGPIYSGLCPQNTGVSATFRSASSPQPIWMQNTNECSMSTGDMRFDPVTANRIWFAEGIGFWYADISSTTPSSVTFISQSAGIEQLVTNQIISPAGGKPIVGFWDRPVFYVNDPAVYPSNHGVNYTNSIIMGWGIDWASSAPTTIVCVCNDAADTSGYSTDGGQTWTLFGSSTPFGAGANPGGAIAASTAMNFVWAPGANATQIFFTINTGTTWSAGAGLPTDGWQGSAFLNRHVLCADRVTANKFYIYNNGATPGIYVSTNGGSSWSRVHAGTFTSQGIDGFNATLQCAPDNAGHLFYTAGQVGGSTTGSFFRSTDAGITWGAIPNVTEVYQFGFGAIAPGKTYPTLYISGFVNGTAATDWGIWRSTDADQTTPTWIRISDGYPLGSFDFIKSIQGDANVYGTVYVGFAGSGAAYGKLNFLLIRDIYYNNDNTPLWLNQAA